MTDIPFHLTMLSWFSIFLSFLSYLMEYDAPISVLTTTWPLKYTFPEVTLALGGRMWAMAIASVDFPQPLSPTMPIDSFVLIPKVT